MFDPIKFVFVSNNMESLFFVFHFAPYTYTTYEPNV